MAYNNVESLSWVKHFPQLTDDEQAVLLALSNDRFQWRTLEGIVGVTGLDKGAVEEVLAKLFRDRLVQPAFSRDRKIVCGLVDRVS